MFFSVDLLVKKGPLVDVWQASFRPDSSISRNVAIKANIGQAVQTIKNTDQKGGTPLALRLKGQLLLGVSRIYSRKVGAIFNIFIFHANIFSHFLSSKLRNSLIHFLLLIDIYIILYVPSSHTYLSRTHRARATSSVARPHHRRVWLA